MINPRCVYVKSCDVVSEVQDVLTNYSSKIKKFVYVSTDYHLLKYAETGSIIYTMPSNDYYNVLRTQPQWNDAQFQAIKQELILNKNNKLVIFNNFSELQAIFTSNFNFKIKI